MGKEIDKPSSSENLVPLLSGTTGSVSGALLGLAVGGPAGAIAGAAVGPVVTYSIDYLTRRRAQAELVLRDAARINGEDVDEFTQALLSSPHKTDLALRILTSGSEAYASEKARALAALLAKIEITEGDPPDDDHVMLNIIDAMERSHMRMLAFIGRQSNESNAETGCTPDSLINAFPEYELTMRSIVRTLELHGLILDQSRLDPVSHGGKVFWQLSPFGRALLDYLQQDDRMYSNEPE